MKRYTRDTDLPTVLFIDNDDSFTLNIVNMLCCLGVSVDVCPHDATPPQNSHWAGLVIGPGPGHPSQAKLSMQAIDAFVHKPILGICMGHQCLALCAGGSVHPSHAIMHGKTSPLCHSHQGIFRDLPSPMAVMRYHSWSVNAKSLPDSWDVLAWAGPDVMAIGHRNRPQVGLQFHPESIASESGELLLKNWIKTF